MTNDVLRRSGRIKVEMLAAGVFYDDAFLRAYAADEGTIEKRRAYGNSDAVQFPSGTKMPPEVILPGGIVAAVNYRPESAWQLCAHDGEYLLSHQGRDIPVTFPARPSFYDTRLANGVRAAQVATLYGNATLGIFSPGFCHYFKEGRPCQFCSLKTTRETQSDHELYIAPDVAREVVALALKSEEHRLKHILLNGGTMKSYDKGFAKHLEILTAISTVPFPDGLRPHLISMPPKDLGLLDTLPATGANLVMCLEIYNPGLFRKICPGKAVGYGRERMFKAYEAAVSVLGAGEVYAGFVAGLESAETLIEGLYRLAEIGVAPAVNVFHSDADTPLQGHQRPTVEMLKEIGRHMGIIFRQNNWVPFIRDTGRNSLDTEAYLGCFD